ncbi:MAG TPA: hypothetical protein VFV31_10110 [Chitinophagaceae bacterium]|nr:hypothetical protein [Chitinophagaceae bacterium]
MYLNIAPERLISEVQKDFNSYFPFLKIEFFNNKSLSRSDFSVKNILPHNRKLGDSQSLFKNGTIEFDEEMKVNELEKQFRDQFNLAVQVFRKSGNLWLETTMTDNWTLQQQNNHGREITNGRDKEAPKEDFDLNRDAFS